MSDCYVCGFPDDEHDIGCPAERLAAAQKRITELEAQVANAKFDIAEARSNARTDAATLERWVERAEKAEAQLAESDKAMDEILHEHSEQLRRVAEAVFFACQRADINRTPWPRDLAAIIAEATKP